MKQRYVWKCLKVGCNPLSGTFSTKNGWVDGGPQASLALLAFWQCFCAGCWPGSKAFRARPGRLVVSHSILGYLKKTIRDDSRIYGKSNAEMRKWETRGFWGAMFVIVCPLWLRSLQHPQRRQRSFLCRSRWRLKGALPRSLDLSTGQRLTQLPLFLG